MANAKEIKRKITSIENTQKITKAMELISTIKMKKAQDLAISKREFVSEMLRIFSRIEKYLVNFPFFSKTKWTKTLAVLITSNKWLCWGYNVNIMKKVNSYIRETWEDLDFVTVWKKAANFVARTWNNLIADFSHDFTDYIEAIFTREISKLLREEFLTWKYSKVIIFYNHYINTIKQIPIIKTLFPLSSEDIKKYLSDILEWYWKIEEKQKVSANDYLFEISPAKLATEFVPMILDMIFNSILLEAKASEHSSRMVAMKAAKDNAGNIASSLTLKYNKARQALITREVSEITAWVESMKDM